MSSLPDKGSTALPAQTAGEQGASFCEAFTGQVGSRFVLESVDFDLFKI